ncbi:MAG: hypothetical protein ACREMG_03140, partial [Gemmatimonadales bacterium]
THDWNMLNNRKDLGLSTARVFGLAPGTDLYFHRYFSTRSRRERLTLGLHPTIWYNDAGGITLGVRAREDYLGRYPQNVTLVSQSVGWGVDGGVTETNTFMRLRNPVRLRSPNVSQTLDVFHVEGRYGLTATVERSRREHLTFGPTWSGGLTLQWLHPDDVRFLDPGYYDDVGTVELAAAWGVTTTRGRWRLGLRATSAGGIAYNRDGLAASGRPELDPFYGRVTIEGTARRALTGRLGLGVRLFAGVAGADEPAAKQRQIYFQGADPLEQLRNPFLRSRGALLVGEDVHYQAPGGAGVRGVDSRISSRAIVALNLELERTLFARPQSRLFNRIALAAFTDLSHGFGGPIQPDTGDEIRFLGDAGVGLRAEHRIGDTRFLTRFDLPLFVSRPGLAQDRSPDDEELAFRWVFSFEPGL